MLSCCSVKSDESTAYPDTINTVLSLYAGYIRYFSKVHGQVNAEVEEYVKQQLIAALFKFRFDR